MQKSKLLIVEDDAYKIDDILKEFRTTIEARLVSSVSTAVKAIVASNFELIVLDMALPTFERSKESSAGSGQPQGGVEILRTLQHLNSDSSVIIISQYAGIEMEKEFVPICDTPTYLKSRYGVNVIGAVHYDFEIRDWSTEFKNILKENFSSFLNNHENTIN